MLRYRQLKFFPVTTKNLRNLRHLRAKICANLRETSKPRNRLKPAFQPAKASVPDAAYSQLRSSSNV